MSDPVRHISKRPTRRPPGVISSTRKNIHFGDFIPEPGQMPNQREAPSSRKEREMGRNISSEVSNRKIGGCELESTARNVTGPEGILSDYVATEAPEESKQELGSAREKRT